MEHRDSGAAVWFVDVQRRHPPLRERMSGYLGSRLLLMARILVAPLVIAGYVGLTVVLFLPLNGVRRIFARRSMPTVVRGDGAMPLGYAATRRA